MDTNLVRRVAFAAVAIPLAFILVWYGGWPLALLIAIAATLGANELFNLAMHRDVRPLCGFGRISAALIPLVVYLAISQTAWLAQNALLLSALWLVLMLAWTLWQRAPDQQPLEAGAITVLAVLYTAALPSFLLMIRHAAYPVRSAAGAWLVFFPLVIVWVCDTVAMFAGRAIGGAKLWPRVSPGKTWSGSIAGVIGGIAVVPLMNWLVLAHFGVALPLWQGLLFGAVLSIVGQIGDLTESLFKRQAGVKDSSALIPGHGGVLDRFDALYFALPVAAGLYRLFGVL